MLVRFRCAADVRPTTRRTRPSQEADLTFADEWRISETEQFHSLNVADLVIAKVAALRRTGGSENNPDSCHFQWRALRRTGGSER